MRSRRLRARRDSVSRNAVRTNVRHLQHTMFKSAPGLGCKRLALGACGFGQRPLRRRSIGQRRLGPRSVGVSGDGALAFPRQKEVARSNSTTKGLATRLGCAPRLTCQNPFGKSGATSAASMSRALRSRRFPTGKANTATAGTSHPRPATNARPFGTRACMTTARAHEGSSPTVVIQSPATSIENMATSRALESERHSVVHECEAMVRKTSDDNTAGAVSMVLASMSMQWRTRIVKMTPCAENGWLKRSNRQSLRKLLSSEITSKGATSIMQQPRA